IEVSMERASYMLAEMPPAPRDFAAASYLVRLRSDAAARPCTACDIRSRGHSSCHRCGGSGWLDPVTVCTACEGGFIVCEVCDGCGEAIGVRVRYVNDVPLWFRDTFVPEAFRYVPSLFSFPQK